MDYTWGDMEKSKVARLLSIIDHCWCSLGI